MSYPPPYQPQPGQPPQPPYVPGLPQQPYPAPPQYGAPYPPQPPRKKPNTKLPWIVGGSVLGLVLLLCLIGAIANGGSDNQQSPAVSAAGKQAAKAEPPGKDPAGAAKDGSKPAQPKTYNVAIGSTITLHGEDDTALRGTVRSAKVYKKGCGEFAPDPDNAAYVVVDVVVEQTKGTGSVNPLDFTFVADDGSTANGLSAAFSGCDKPSLDSTNSLRAGQKRSGKIAFDVTSSRGAVEWAPGGLGADTVGSWKVG